jgi:hypothetical protein
MTAGLDLLDPERRRRRREIQVEGDGEKDGKMERGKLERVRKGGKERERSV